MKCVRRCPSLPHNPLCSTIGAERLSFRVRNGTGRFPLAMTAVTLLTYNISMDVFVKNRIVDAYKTCYANYYFMFFVTGLFSDKPSAY